MSTRKKRRKRISDPKKRLITLRISDRHYDYLRSTAAKNNMNISEFLRIIIEKAEGEFQNEGLSKAEIATYLKNLPHEERDELVKSVENWERRKIITFIDGVLERNPEISVKKLCGKMNEEFNLPVTMDLKRTANLKIRSYRRKRKFIAILEKENDKLL